MDIRVVHGIIDRRILVNYQLDAQVLRKILPAPFRPKLMHGVGIAGVCLIRLQSVSPRFVPSALGISSENAAHRIAVEWEENGTRHEGVYVPRRDTSSWANVLVGGRLFPGTHSHAHFEVTESGDRYQVALDSQDRKTHLLVDARVASALPETSIFHTLQEASDFFEAGSLGYSATPQPGRYDGIELRSFNWKVTPLDVQKVESSFFADQTLFPAGSVKFDCALLMRDIKHEWHSHGMLNQLCA